MMPWRLGAEPHRANGPHSPYAAPRQYLLPQIALPASAPLLQGNLHAGQGVAGFRASCSRAHQVHRLAMGNVG
jgi:hypothetical protein